MVSNGQVANVRYTHKLTPFYLPVEENLKVSFQNLDAYGEYLVRYHNMNENKLV